MPFLLLKVRSSLSSCLYLASFTCSFKRITKEGSKCNLHGMDPKNVVKIIFRTYLNGLNAKRRSALLDYRPLGL